MMRRREFFGQSMAGLGASVVSRPARAAMSTNIRAVALDGLTTFDPRPVVTLAERLFPGRGTELGNAWRTRQFEYTWLRTLTGRYVDFWHVTEDALVFSAKLLGLQLTSDKRARLMQAFFELSAWPEAQAALKSLRDAGVRLAFLSNFTAAMLDAAVKNSGLVGLFEPHLTTDLVRAFKPDPRAYRMGLDAFALPREQIVFAAFGGWDAAGAKLFGFPTFWVNRLSLPVEELGVGPDATGPTLVDLAKFVLAGRGA